MKVLHLLYQSLPNSAGSSTRSHSLIKSQIKEGIDAKAFSSPIQSPKNFRYRCSAETIDGVVYERCYFFKGLTVGRGGAFKQLLKLTAWPFFVIKVLLYSIKYKPNVIHAHSMYYCCFAAVLVGFFCRIPVVYEVRSRWEINPQARASKFKILFAGSVEKIACKLVDRVVVISIGLAEYVESFISAKPLIIRNAVLLEQISNEKTIRNKYANSKRKLKFGYVGSVIELEGIDFIIDSLFLLKKKGREIEFAVYGGGSVLGKLKEKSLRLGVKVDFKGEIPFAKINEAYEQLDVVINYRRDVLISHTVTPLKPLEAIAHGCMVICSDVKGMVEIIGERDNAVFVPPNNPLKLSNYMAGLVLVEDLNVEKLLVARRYLLEHRTWEENAKSYKALYIALQKNKKGYP